MPNHHSIRRAALVVPFLVVFYFPLVALLFSAAIQNPVDWNHGIYGVQGIGPQKMDWSMTSWLEGTFQNQFSNWWENQCPGRAFFLRLFNQADYSLFRSSYMLQGKLAIGPGGQLDSKEYVRDASHQGIFPPGQVLPLVDQLERLRTQLQQQGKSFLVVTTPHKAVTYPETMPHRFLAYDHSRPRPYDELVQRLAHSDIPFVDGAGIIHQLAGHTRYPLFVRGGIHWNNYAAAQVAPAVIEKIAQLTGKAFPSPPILSVKMAPAAESSQEIDSDLAHQLNLFWPPLDYECPNLEMGFPPKGAGPPPRIVFACGSFGEALLDVLQGPRGRDRLQVPFTFYTKQFFEGEPRYPISRQKYENALAASDLVMLEINEVVPLTTVEGLSSLIEEAARRPVPRAAYNISFAEGGDSVNFTGAGFSGQESTFRWTDGDTASLEIQLPPGVETYTLTARVAPFLDATHRHQRVEIQVQGKIYGADDLRGDEIRTMTATFPASGWIRIDFNFTDAVSPAPDARKLALAFYSLQIFPAKAGSP